MAKILVIEDELDQAMSLKYILEFNGFETILAKNGKDGKDGVDLALQELPDLVLIDINMPVMNGYEVLKSLCSKPETYVLPVLFLTAISLKEDQRLGMELGADDYLTKPYTSSEIINVVKARLNRDSGIKHHFEENMNRLRKNITLSLPHELNTPISSILGFSQMIKSLHKSLSDEDIRAMCDNIFESGQRLAEIVKKFNNYIMLLSKSPDDPDLQSKKLVILLT